MRTQALTERPDLKWDEAFGSVTTARRRLGTRRRDAACGKRRHV